MGSPGTGQHRIVLSSVCVGGGEPQLKMLATLQVPGNRKGMGDSEGWEEDPEQRPAPPM